MLQNFNNKSYTETWKNRSLGKARNQTGIWRSVTKANRRPRLNASAQAIVEKDKDNPAVLRKQALVQSSIPRVDVFENPPRGLQLV